MSPKSRVRVVVLTVLGTLFCIVAAFAVDSYSYADGTWAWGSQALNNFVIPAVLAPPFFYLLLSKMRELAIAHDELLVVASTDSLTSCLNRRAFTTLVDAYLEKTREVRAEKGGAFLIIDVDHFKDVNDRYGHPCGDEALKIIADAIKQNVREVDLVGRIGGEEFGVFLPGLDENGSVAVAERIRLAINGSTFAPGGNSTRLSASVGGATFDNGTSFSELFRHADHFLYVAKRGGRDRVEIHPIRRISSDEASRFH